MMVKEKMAGNIELIEEKLPVVVAQEKMREKKIGFLPVFNGEKMSGIIAERDIAKHVNPNGEISGNIEVEAIMNKNVKYVVEDHDLEEVAKLMKEQNQREVLVVGRDKSLKGIFSLDALES